MINIQFSKAAKEAIRKKMKQKDVVLKLVYDTEGCGCGVSGVPTLYMVDEIQDGVKAKSDTFPIYYDEQQRVFFEEQLMIDINHHAYGAFVLKSNGQIYSSYMSLVDAVSSL